jgi:hypothetical protein
MKLRESAHKSFAAEIKSKKIFDVFYDRRHKYVSSHAEKILERRLRPFQINIIGFEKIIN